MDKSIDQVIDEIVDILGYDTWQQVGAFMEDLHAAIHLPLGPSSLLYWTLNARTKTARVMHCRNAIVSATGDTLEEAVCRAWLKWHEGKR